MIGRRKKKSMKIEFQEFCHIINVGLLVNYLNEGFKAFWHLFVAETII